jgi:hypothetical protein
MPAQPHSAASRDFRDAASASAVCAAIRLKQKNKAQHFQNVCTCFAKFGHKSTQTFAGRRPHGGVSGSATFSSLFTWPLLKGPFVFEVSAAREHPIRTSLRHSRSLFPGNRCLQGRDSGVEKALHIQLIVSGATGQRSRSIATYRTSRSAEYPRAGGTTGMRNRKHMPQRERA